MKLWRILAIGLLSAVAVPGHLHAAQSGVVGSRFVGLDGRIIRPGLENGELKPAVIVLLDTGCPVARRYSPELNDFHDQATRLGIEFYGLLSDSSLSVKEAQDFRDEFLLTFPVIWDSNGELASRLQPTHFPECFVFDQADEVVYRGRIDNRYVSPGRLRANVTAHELRDAMQAVSDGLRPEVEYEAPVGCVFEGWPEEIHEPEFNRHIAPIIYANCSSCHRQGEVAPFALESFEQASRRAQMISFVVEERLMPPWQAEPGFGHFRQEMFLSERQIELISAWAESGAAEGDTADEIASPEFAEDGWALGRPDQVIRMPQPFEVPASGDDIYRYFVISNPLEHEMVITAMDFKPGDPSVVHHMNSFVDFAGRARALDAEDDEPGFSVFGTGSFMSYDGSGTDQAYALGGWVPGMGAMQFPKGYGIYIPAGGEVVIEVHYHLSGKATTDQSELAFYFASEPVEHYIDGTVIGTQNLSIEVDDGDYQRHFWMDVPADIELVDILPHMHYIGKSARVEATLPDGEKLPLVNIRNWDFRWQSLYTFRNPVRLPAGSRIDAWLSFDNSKDNPANPLKEPQEVRWGWETGDEMAEVWMTYVPADRADSGRIYEAAAMSWYRSGDPQVNESGINETIQKLAREGFWTDEGEALLIEINSSGKGDEIIDRLSDEIRLNPRNANLLVARGSLIAAGTWSETDMQTLTALATRADADYDAALEIDNYHWDAWMSKAVFYAGAQDRQYENEAIGMFRQLVEGQEQYEQPSHYAKAYIQYGDLLARLNREDEAAEVWQRGLRFHPENAVLKERLER